MSDGAAVQELITNEFTHGEKPTGLFREIIRRMEIFQIELGLQRLILLSTNRLKILSTNYLGNEM